MNLSRKLFLIFSPVLFISATIVQVYLQTNLILHSGMEEISAMIMISSTIWILLMACIYGSLYKKKWALIAGSVIFVLTILGAFMKLMHWPGAGLITYISPMLFGIIYLIHFSLKKKKKFVDVAKLLFVISSLLVYEIMVSKRGRNYEEGALALWILLLLILFISVWIHIYKYKKPAGHLAVAESGNEIFYHPGDTGQP